MQLPAHWSRRPGSRHQAGRPAGETYTRTHRLYGHHCPLYSAIGTFRGVGWVGVSVGVVRDGWGRGVGVGVGKVWLLGWVKDGCMGVAMWVKD